MERMLIFGTVKLWHVTAVILFIDLIVVRSGNMVNISHLAGALFGFLFIKLLENGTDLSKIITGLSIFQNLFQKNTPLKKVYKIASKPAPKTVSKIVVKR
jgi:hypothetical protein